MKVRRFLAKDAREAMKMVREALGNDAIILANQSKENGVEIIAAVDFEDPLIRKVEAESGRTLAAVPTPILQAPLQAPLAATAPIHKSLNQQVAEKVHSIEISQERALSHLQMEVSALKTLMEEQLSGLVWGGLKHKKPVQVAMARRLAETGFQPNVINRLLDTLEDTLTLEDAWYHMADTLSASIRTDEGDLLHAGGVVAFTGPSGVGKTLSIVKLISQYALKEGSDKIGLITTDVRRVAAYEQLKTYARILDVPLKVVEDSRQLKEALHEFRLKRLVVIDTPSMNQQNTMRDICEMFYATGLAIKYYLVLAANMQFSAYKRVQKLSEGCPISGCIITKVDETRSLGELVSFLIETQIATTLVSQGAQVPDDLRVVRAQQLIEKTIKLGRQFRTDIHEDTLARQFQEVGKV